jgi:hypothetical protein
MDSGSCGILGILSIDPARLVTVDDEHDRFVASAI